MAKEVAGKICQGKHLQKVMGKEKYPEKTVQDIIRKERTFQEILRMEE